MNELRGNRRYETVECLGRGWNGSVHKVVDRESGAVLAAKVLDVRDSERLYRLKQEFRSLARLRHPNLVELYELVVDPDESYFTMQWIDGVDFLAYVRGENGARDPEATLERLRGAARQLVAGVMALHRSGTLHRDLKPTNVLVDRAGRLAVLDFGLSATLGAGDTAGELAGTVDYMAPEQLWGMEVGAPADWFSVGVMLYEALAGELPFPPGGAYGQVAAPIRTRAPWVPEALEEVILAALRSTPEERPSGELLLAALGGVPEGSAQSAVTPRLEECFVGRAAERAVLAEALGSIGDGRPVVVHVHGPSGIGKTELVRRFLEDVEQADDALVLRGRCHAQETVPYNAFDGLVDALTRHLRDLPAPALPPDAAALLRLFPVLARAPAFETLAGIETPAEPRELRRMGFAALRRLFADLSQSRRLVAWVDDAQWCDEDSRALAREILRAPDAPAIMFLFTHRPEDRERVPFAAAEAADGIARVEVPLEPLAAEESRELARLLSGGHRELDVEALAAQAGGSPFFLSALVQQRLGAGDTAEAPADLAAVVRSRVERLPKPEQRLLELVSVAGQPLERVVALEASAVGKQSWTMLINLEKENLLRTVKVRDEDGIEIYHDRIRQALLGALSADGLRERHHLLAESLSARPDPDARSLFRHYLGAEELAPAARWGVEAADRADRALAFAEAADLFAQVMPLVAEAERRPLELRRAEALVNAGHGAAAAPIFLAAVPAAASEERLDLRRRAAEQYLVTGHIDQGVEVVRELLAACGVKYPATQRAAVVGTLGRLLAIRWRGLDVPLSSHPGAGTLPADACYAAFKGLAQVDPMRGIYFGVRALSFSLAAADRFRIARDLMSTGAALIALRGRIGRWAMEMVERAKGIADELGDPYLLGQGSTAMAQVSMLDGRWGEMLERCDRGADILRRKCRGVGWELDVARMAALRALEELGELQERERRILWMLREAEASNDVYATATALLFHGFSRLFCDDLDGAAQATSRAVKLWTARDVHIQHFYALRLDCYRLLCEGDEQAAWAKVSSEWPALLRSNMLRHVLLRLDAHLLRARVALALATHDRAKRFLLLRTAERDARCLAREGRGDAIAHASVLHAACQAQRGRRTEALRLLEQGQRGFAEQGMAVCAAFAALRAAQLSGRPEHATAAVTALRKSGVANPNRLASMHAPGFSGATPQ